MTRPAPAPALAALALLVGVALLAPSTPSGAAAADDDDRTSGPRFAGAADLLAAERAMRRSIGRGVIRHVEFDPDDESGLAVELELVADGRSRLVELRRHEGDAWRVEDITPRETSVRSRRYFERLVGVVAAAPHLGPGEAAVRAESAHRGAIAIEVDLLLVGGEPVYEVELVLGADSFDVHVPARAVRPATSEARAGPAPPPVSTYACLVEAVEASSRHGRPFAFASQETPDGLVHEVLVVDESGRTRAVRHAARTVVPLGTAPSTRSAPDAPPPADALADTLRSLDRILVAAGAAPAAMTAGVLRPADRGDEPRASDDPERGWRLRAWTPTAAGVLEVEVALDDEEVVLRLGARRAGGGA